MVNLQQDEEKAKEEEQIIIDNIDQGLLIKRSIWLSETIDENTAARCGEFLTVFGGDDPINIYINSAGGGAISALAITDLIRVHESPIYTYCFGHVASAALMIFVAGDQRFASPHSRFMWHAGDFILEGPRSIPAHETAVLEAKTEIKLCEDFVAERTEIPKSILNKAKKQDVHFGIEEALKWKVTDYVIQYKR